MRWYGWPESHVRLKITSAQGWVWFASSLQDEMSMFGANYELQGLGYIGQERENILRQDAKRNQR